MGQRKKHHKNAKRVILLSLAGAATVIAVFFGVFYSRIVNNPASLFVDMRIPSPEFMQAVSSEPTLAMPTSTRSPAPTLNPFEQLKETADLSMMKDTVNILLIGVDYAEERETWSGKHAYHSDVMIVLAINFQENTVDMISLPRDTYAQVPGVNGIYKLNAAIDCGGGYPEGLPKVAEAASWMLGGLPVDYYYAVTMPVVKELVNTIDGLDYDIDVDFEIMGRTYKTGIQHMDGQAVLDYMRVRKNVQQAGDLGRINRQKKMLVALFRKMKSSNLLVNVPQFITTFDGKLLTNTSLEQTAALAVFAYGLPEENIRMHSMDGSVHDIFNWNFCVTNQSKRVQLIKDIYGVEVPQYEEYGLDFCLSKWAQMRSNKYFENAEKVIGAAEKYTSSYNLPAMPAEVIEVPTALLSNEMPKEDPEEIPVAQSNVMSHTGNGNIPSLLSEARNALSGARSALSESGSSADTAMATLMHNVTALANAFDYGALDWRVTYKNEIEVDFR